LAVRVVPSNDTVPLPAVTSALTKVVLAGRGSVSTTLVAVPGPAFETAILYVMSPPTRAVSSSLLLNTLVSAVAVCARAPTNGVRDRASPARSMKAAEIDRPRRDGLGQHEEVT
jgi:hypothetical protein